MLRRVVVLANFTARRAAICRSGSELASLYLIKNQVSYTRVAPKTTPAHHAYYSANACVHPYGNYTTRTCAHAVWDPTKRRLLIMGRGLAMNKQLPPQRYRKLKCATVRITESEQSLRETETIRFNTASALFVPRTVINCFFSLRSIRSFIMQGTIFRE